MKKVIDMTGGNNTFAKLQIGKQKKEKPSIIRAIQNHLYYLMKKGL